MDASHHLLQPNDSFSYAWLIDVKFPFSAAAADAAFVGDSQRSHDDGAGSFIEIDPDGFFSMRWSTQNEDDFDFSLPQPQCSCQVHADQIFSEGQLLPLLDGQPTFACAGTTSARRLAKSQSVNSNRFDSPRRHCAGSSTPSPKKTARKYFCFLTPLYKMVKDLRLVASSSSFASSFSSSSCSFKSVSAGNDSARSSPRSSDAMSSADSCRSTNADISIDDAILHCKKSIVATEAQLMWKLFDDASSQSHPFQTCTDHASVKTRSKQIST